MAYGNVQRHKTLKKWCQLLTDSQPNQNEEGDQEDGDENEDERYVFE